MRKYKNFLKILFIFVSVFVFTSIYAEEEEIYLKAISDQIQVITKDLKTLEKAVYQKSNLLPDDSSKAISSNRLNEDIMTKHLLKLNEIEDQFRELTNKFEEVNFKLDKLSSRVTKIQSDNQLRFSDLESGNPNPNKNIENQDVLILNDKRVFHYATPIYAQYKNVEGFRDSIIITIKEN